MVRVVHDALSECHVARADGTGGREASQGGEPRSEERHWAGAGDEHIVSVGVELRAYRRRPTGDAGPAGDRQRRERSAKRRWHQLHNYNNSRGLHSARAPHTNVTPEFRDPNILKAYRFIVYRFLHIGHFGKRASFGTPWTASARPTLAKACQAFVLPNFCQGFGLYTSDPWEGT